MPIMDRMERRAPRWPTQLFNKIRGRASGTIARERKRETNNYRLPALNDWWRRPLKKHPQKARKWEKGEQVVTDQPRILRRARHKCDPPSNLLSSVIHDVPKGFRFFIQTRFWKRTRFWVGSDVLHFPRGSRGSRGTRRMAVIEGTRAGRPFNGSTSWAILSRSAKDRV